MDSLTMMYAAHCEKVDEIIAEIERAIDNGATEIRFPRDDLSDYEINQIKEAIERRIG